MSHESRLGSADHAIVVGNGSELIKELMARFPGLPLVGNQFTANPLPPDLAAITSPAGEVFLLAIIAPARLSDQADLIAAEYAEAETLTDPPLGGIGFIHPPGPER